MRISLVADVELINTNYRAYQPAQALARQGHELHYNRRGEARFSAPALLASDVVLIHRYADDEIQGLIRRLRAAGVGVVWDNDDDITAIPRSNPLYRKFGGANARLVAGNVTRTVRLADVVTTPSAVLAEGFRRSGAVDVRVLENFLPREFAKVKPIKHDGVVVVWVAALEHQADYQQLRLQQCFERLLETHPDLRLLTVGLGLGLRSDRYEQIKHVPFLDLARTIAMADIGIAPLAQSAWNESRSNVKLKEYGAAGLAWLASPVGPYRGLGEAEGGRLVPDDGWLEALDALVRDKRERRKLAKRAASWAGGQSIAKNSHLWEQALKAAIASARAHSGTERARDVA
jgi:glycosyltransferase involved in cell wall biosynthesis